MKENDYISREEVISQLEYCLANFTDYKKALEETLDKVKHTRTISLSKGHGDLVDRNAIEVLRIGNTNREYDKGFDAGVSCMVNRILEAPTIIEADKESD